MHPAIHAVYNILEMGPASLISFLVENYRLRALLMIIGSLYRLQCHQKALYKLRSLIASMPSVLTNKPHHDCKKKHKERLKPSYQTESHIVKLHS